MGADMTQQIPELGNRSVLIRVTALVDAKQAGWDAYVSQHPEGTGYHCLAWLEAVASAYGHRAHPIVATGAGGRVVGVMPLCELRKPFGKTEWVTQPFCDLGGPVADSPAIAAQLQQAALVLVKQQGGKALELRLAGGLLDDSLWREGKGEPVDTDNRPAQLPAKVSMLCPLAESSEALIKSYKPKLRSQIRKAEKNGLTSEVVSSEAGIQAFYPVFAANMHRLGSPVHSLDWFLALQRAYGEQLLVGLVRFESTVVGAGIVLENGQRASIPWASTLAEYNHLAPNMLLYWSLLARVTDDGCHIFDFGRSTPGEGTYRFKKQWGAEPHELRWLSLDVHGAEQPQPASPSAMATRLRGWVERVWQRLPLPMANRLGPLLRKYISL